MKRDEFVERLTNLLLFNQEGSHIEGVVDEGDGLLVVNLDDGTSYFLNVTFNYGGSSSDN